MMVPPAPAFIREVRAKPLKVLSSDVMLSPNFFEHDRGQTPNKPQAPYMNSPMSLRRFSNEMALG